MPLQKLRKLKQKINNNLNCLIIKCPFTQNLLNSIDILLQDNPTKIKVRLWIEGCIEMIVELEKHLHCIENQSNCVSKNRLIFLKKHILKHQVKLKEKFPQIKTLLKAIDALLNSPEVSPLARPWIKGVDKTLQQIEIEFISLEYLGEGSRLPRH